MSETTTEAGTERTGRVAPDDDIGDPPLESGDAMTRAEFERRYASMPPGVKCELIGGIVYVASPTRRRHSGPHMEAGAWLAPYRWSTPGTEAGDNGTVQLSEDDEPQPDLYIRILPEAGGRTRTVDDYVVGGPELVVEVASSSRSLDLNAKLETYRREGVPEYLVILPREREVRWHRLVEGRYERLEADDDGIIRSRVFPGLWLDPVAFLEDRGPDVQAVLQRGLASEEHAAFVKALAERTRAG